MADQHVVKRDDGWAVKRQGASRDTSHHETQQQAIREASQIARNQGGEVFIHGRDGKIRERNTLGKPDPFPPRG